MLDLLCGMDPSIRPMPSRKRQRGDEAGAHVGQADAGDAKPEPQQPAAAKAPVLPWMRVPITIQEGSGVPLSEVHGLAPALAAALTSSETLMRQRRAHADPSCAHMRAGPRCLLFDDEPNTATLARCHCRQGWASASCSPSRPPCGASWRAAAARRTTCASRRPRAAARRWRTRCRS